MIKNKLNFLFARLKKINLNKLEQKNNPQIEENQNSLDFKERYYQFRILLSSNNKALDMMGDLEEALQGSRAFGMNFIRSRCTALSAEVYKMIDYLCLLAPLKYEALKAVFSDIQTNLRQKLEEGRRIRTDHFVMPLTDIDKEFTEQVGPKMANLGEIYKKLGLLVPQGFVITTYAHKYFFEQNALDSEINLLLQSADFNSDFIKKNNLLHEEQKNNQFALISRIQELIMQTKLPEELSHAILNAYDTHFQNTPKNKIALRSSALAEDTLQISFAGQFRSILNIDKEDLLECYKEVLASMYSMQAMSYRYNFGLADHNIFMGVGCLKMMPAKAGGVIYSRNPLDPEDKNIYIYSAWGLPGVVVDGSESCSTYIFSRQWPLKVIDKQIANQERKLVNNIQGAGLKKVSLGKEEKNVSPVTEEQAKQLAEIAIVIENHYTLTQDIEWIIGPDDQVYILQSRPLQQHKAQQDNEIDASGVSPLLQGGNTAGYGIAVGQVYKVESEADLLTFPQGGILVSSQALPKWAAVISRCAGLITEHGSVAGHLANVAREYKLPALFGLEQACTKLKQGWTITLDAQKKRIYPGATIAGNYLAPPEQALGQMQDTQVYRILKQVSADILPLNLLDPDSVYFKADSCKTLHDITRFVHEKSVQEMFNFMSKSKHSAYQGKQLKTVIPMQWWVLDLDDGFKHPVMDKYVKLENIQSIPMLAIWQGVTAVPWEGPPAIDSRGFASVLYQATLNPQLVEGTGSEFTNRNYFIISRTFCNLFSRFGFHLSSIEALVGERTRENYVRFYFKGGAADLPRRISRACLLRDLLADYGFQTELKEDTLFARMDNFESNYLRKRLKILGYLIIHTRQLDMVMSRKDLLGNYRKKIEKEIKSISE